MKIDLHNHSTYSDGLSTIKDLCIQANKQNVSIFAITDHDCVINFEESEKIAKEYNIRLIAGIELSTNYKSESIHLIGLFKNNVVPYAISNYYEQLVISRKQRAIKMMTNIKEIYNVCCDLSVFNNMNVITRGNMFRELLNQNKNLTSQEASFLVSSKSKAYIPMYRFNVEDGIKFLKENNAICILAHPTLISSENIDDILQFDFDGIEARYPKNKENDEEKFSVYAKKTNKFISAGSDDHGDFSHARLGTSTLNEEEFSIIDKLLQGDKEK